MKRAMFHTSLSDSGKRGQLIARKPFPIKEQHDSKQDTGSAELNLKIVGNRWVSFKGPDSITDS